MSTTATMPALCTVNVRIFDLDADRSPSHIIFGQVAFQLNELSPASVAGLQRVLNDHRGCLTEDCQADLVSWTAQHATDHEGRLRLLLNGQVDRGRRIEISLVDLTLPTVCTVDVSVFNDDGSVKSFELPEVPTDTVRYLQEGIRHFNGVLTNPCGDLMLAWALMCCPQAVPMLQTELQGYRNLGFRIDATRMDHTTVFVVEPPTEGVMS